MVITSGDTSKITPAVIKSLQARLHGRILFLIVGNNQHVTVTSGLLDFVLMRSKEFQGASGAGKPVRRAPG